MLNLVELVKYMYMILNLVDYVGCVLHHRHHYVKLTAHTRLIPNYQEITKLYTHTHTHTHTHAETS